MRTPPLHATPGAAPRAPRSPLTAHACREQPPGPPRCHSDRSPAAAVRARSGPRSAATGRKRELRRRVPASSHPPRAQAPKGEPRDPAPGRAGGGGPAEPAAGQSGDGRGSPAPFPERSRRAAVVAAPTGRGWGPLEEGEPPRPQHPARGRDAQPRGGGGAGAEKRGPRLHPHLLSAVEAAHWPRPPGPHARPVPRPPCRGGLERFCPRRQLPGGGRGQ